MSLDTPKRIFKCRCCSSCCRWPGIVRLTDEDIARLAAFLELSEEDVLQQYTILAPDRRSLVLNTPHDAPCRFLTSEGLCQIHPAKPQQCRDFPKTWDVPQEFRRLCKGEWVLEEEQ